MKARRWPRAGTSCHRCGRKVTLTREQRWYQRSPVCAPCLEAALTGNDFASGEKQEEPDWY